MPSKNGTYDPRMRRWSLVGFCAAMLGALAGWGLITAHPGDCAYAGGANPGGAGAGSQYLTASPPPCPAHELSIAAAVLVGVLVAGGVVLLIGMLGGLQGRRN